MKQIARVHKSLKINDISMSYEQQLIMLCLFPFRYWRLVSYSPLSDVGYYLLDGRRMIDHLSHDPEFEVEVSEEAHDVDWRIE